jgi:hypothetical protein
MAAVASGRLVDRATQSWVRFTGRRIDLSVHRWLDGPCGSPDGIGDAWIREEATRLGGSVAPATPEDGLLESMGAIASMDLDPACLRGEIVDFYTRTSQWRMELWFQWCSIARPFGFAISTLFARRLAQLSLPLRPLDAALGIESRIVKVVSTSGVPLGTAWVRTLRSTGETVYSGWYGTATLPGRADPSLRVVFPLPNGSVIVFLRPESRPGGGLRLLSPHEPFGGHGAYLLVRDEDGRHAWVRRAPIVETFDLYVDEEGVLRTNHSLRLWNFRVIDLHYRLDPSPTATASPASEAAVDSGS